MLDHGRDVSGDIKICVGRLVKLISRAASLTNGTGPELGWQVGILSEITHYRDPVARPSPDCSRRYLRIILWHRPGTEPMRGIRVACE